MRPGMQHAPRATCPKSNMPQHTWTARAHSSPLATLIRARAGALKWFLFVCSYLPQHYCIFHCLNIPQNSPNLEYKSHLAKNCIICHPEFTPLGGAIGEESVFWLITPIYSHNSHKPYMHAFPELCWISWYRPISAYHFSPQFCQMSQTNFFEILPGSFADWKETLHTASVDPPDRNVLKVPYYCFSSISHSCQMSNNTVFEMHCSKPIWGPYFQLSKSHSSELYWALLSSTESRLFLCLHL